MLGIAIGDVVTVYHAEGEVTAIVRRIAFLRGTPNPQDHDVYFEVQEIDNGVAKDVSFTEPTTGNIWWHYKSVKLKGPGATRKTL